MDENTALCRIIMRQLNVDKTKEPDCLKFLQSFMEHKDFEKTVGELAGLTGADKDKIMDVIANSCIPCAQEEKLIEEGAATP